MLLFAAAAFAQDNKKIDLLLQRLSAAVSDTDRAKIYNKLSVEYNDYDSVKADDYQRKAYAIFGKAGNTEGLANCFFVKGILLENAGKKDSALILYNRANELAIQIHNKDLSAAIMIDMGLIYSGQTNFPKATEYYTKALTLSEETGNTGNMANATRKLANMYLHEREFAKAKQMYQKVYQLFDALKDSASMGESLGSIGFASRYGGMPDTAIVYFNKAIDLFNRVRYYTFIPIAYTEIGRTYLEQKKYAEAVVNFKKALALYKTVQHNAHVDALNIFTGQALTELGVYEEAKRYLDTGLVLSIKSSDIEMQQEACWGFYNYYRKIKDYPKALDYLQEYSEIKDSISNKAQLATITEMNTKYETEKKERQIAEQQFQINKRNYYIAGISTVLVLASLLAWSIYRRYRLKQKARHQQEILHQQEAASRAIIEAEENERRRISRDLHDGVGQLMSAARMNLSAIEEMISFATPEHRHNYEKVIALIDESCNEVRVVSHNMMPNALLKAGLACAIREFIDKIDSHVIKVTLHAEGLNDRIDTNVETVLYRVIQECVNNVIKHARATNLDISLIKDADGISATIEDNGRGFEASKAAEFEGIGLKNIQSRINYLKGTVEWDSSPGRGTLVAIHVPL